MFEEFLAQYQPESDREPSQAWADPQLLATPGYAGLAARVAGLAMGGGMFRFHDDVSGPACQELIDEVFGKYAGRAVPFAMDWLGRQFAIDGGRMTDAGPHLLLLEHSSGSAYAIDETLDEFLNGSFVTDPEIFLEGPIFDEWRSSGGAVPSVGQCVGFKLSPLLGGEFETDNMEIADLAVDWSFAGQIYQQVKDLPDGTVITDISIQ